MLAPDDDVDDPGLVLERDEDHALGGPGPLPQDHQPRHRHPGVLRRIARAGAGSAGGRARPARRAGAGAGSAGEHGNEYRTFRGRRKPCPGSAGGRNALDAPRLSRPDDGRAGGADGEDHLHRARRDRARRRRRQRHDRDGGRPRQRHPRHRGRLRRRLRLFHLPCLRPSRLGRQAARARTRWRRTCWTSPTSPTPPARA